jgi:ribonuclease VapC
LSFVLDSSVFVAIVLQEAEKDHFKAILQQERNYCVSWPTLLETWTVLAGRTSAQKADNMLKEFQMSMHYQTVAFDAEHYALAREAYERFRLNGHPARLNYGDIMSYALARAMDLPLLFKGTDFGQTDVKVHPGSILS